MTTKHLSRPFKLGLTAALALIVAWPAAMAQTAATKPKPKAVKKAVPTKAAEPNTPPAAASPEQIDAAGLVFYGTYECEFNQTIHIVANPKYPSYVDVKLGKADYLMKPVESSTGAIRLEDVRGQTLMVQISSKSMLLNVKTAQRIVDDCVSPKQRELIEAAKAAKAERAAAAAASAAASAVEGKGPADAASGAPVNSAPPASAASPAAAPASAASTTMPEPLPTK